MEILDAPEAPRATRFAFEINCSVCDLASEFNAELDLAGNIFELPADGLDADEEPETPPIEP